MRLILQILFCVFGGIVSMQAQSSGFIDLKQESRGIALDDIRASKKSGEREMTRFAEEHLMYPGESLAEAVTRSQVSQEASGQAEGNTPYTAKFTTALTWGTVYALDATSTEAPQLFYTKALELNTNYPANYFYYTGALFTFYDENFQQVYQIHVEAPKLGSGAFAQCNDIRIVGEYSKGLYNSDSSWEFLFMTHWFDTDQTSPGLPSTQEYSYFIFQSNGTLYHTLEKTEGVYQYAGTTNNTRKLIVGEWKYEADTTVLKVYAARNLKAGTGLLKTHKIATNQMVRMMAPLIVVETIGGTPRYGFPHYENKYYATGSPTFTVTPNNKFVMDLYSLDVSSATANNLYKSLTLPIEGFDAAKMSELEFAVTFSDYELTTDVFNSDANIEILYGVNDYYPSCDCDLVNYYLVNESGAVLKSLKTLIPNIKMIRKLADLPGYGRQYAVFSDANSTTEIAFFNIEDWAVAQRFTSVYKGEQLTSNFDRTIYGNGYAYVFEMDAAFKEGDDYYSKVNWYDAATGNLLKSNKFNIGPKGAYFSPAITPTTLNPYFINTDDKMEYVGAARIYGPTGNAYSSFRIYNEDGDLLFLSDANDSGQLFGGMGAYSTGGTAQYLIVAYVNGTTSRLYNFIPLPLTSFPAGGNGTPANPYMISSAGDFDAIRSNPAASYQFANDIDMTSLLSTKYATTGWKPFILKEGTRINGNGYQIKNLKFQNVATSYVALFEQMNKKTVIENLTFTNAEILTTANNTIGAAFIAYMLSDSASIRNVHIQGNIGIGSGIGSSAAIAGLAMTLSGGSNILQSSFEGNIVTNLANGGTKGGIAGTLQSGGFIADSYTKGNITITNASGGTVGGIVGTMNTGRPRVENCYSTMNVNVQYTGQNLGAGGIVGSLGQSLANKGLVQNCYATGRIRVVSTNASDNIFAGGIIGTTTTNNNTNTTLNMSGLVALNDSISAKKAGRISGINNADLTYDVIQDCYALSTIKIGSVGAEAVISSERTDTINGKDVLQTALTKAFYTGIGWKFGNSFDSPWVWIEGNNPHLWFEYAVKSVTLNQSSAHIDVAKTLQLTASVLPLNALNQTVTWSSSDAEVATVNENGLVTGLKFGEVVITATTEEGGFKATCTVKVGLAESITLNSHNLELLVGDETTLTAAILPTTATYTELTWKVVNSTITENILATVDNTGKVKAQAEGTCFVIVQLNNSNLTDTCAVKITRPTGVHLPETNDLSVTHIRGQIEINGIAESVSVYDVNGKAVYINSKKTDRLAIPTGNWNKGVYVVKVIGIHTTSYKKLIIQ